jgi:DNA-binding beta-propeller fold protein YncE
MESRLLRRRNPGTLLGVVLVMSGFALAAAPAGELYRSTGDIDVGGVGGWDYLSVDPAAHRLYVSHATKIVVIDTAKDAVVGEISDLPGVHGMAVAADLHRGFTTNGGEAKVSIIDLQTLKLVSKVDTGQNPDAYAYDPGRQEMYAFNGTGRSATVIDAKTGSVVATIPLDGRPETGQADPKAGRVYVNIEDKSAIAVIDTKTHTVVATWPIAPGEEPTGMAIDLSARRLFVGCGGNKLMLMVDSTNGKVVASVPAGQGIDATWFDPGTKLAFSSSGDGAVAIAREDGPNTLTPVQMLTTARGARTMTLDPVTHNIYLAAVKYEAVTPPAAGAPPAAPAPGRGRGPAMVPNSMHVMVFGYQGK